MANEDFDTAIPVASIKCIEYMKDEEEDDIIAIHLHDSSLRILFQKKDREDFIVVKSKLNNALRSMNIAFVLIMRKDGIYKLETIEWDKDEKVI